MMLKKLLDSYRSIINNRCLLLIFLLTASSLLLSTPLFAQSISLGISPPLIESVIKPGKSLLIAYKLENFGDPTLVRINVRPFVPKNNTGDITVQDEFSGPIRFSLENNNITMNQPFFLRPNQNQQILLRIRVPEGAPEGDYYYTLLVETEPPPSQEGSTASRAQVAIGSNILLSVSRTGTSEINAKIALFETLKEKAFGRLKIFDSNEEIPLQLIVQNNGKNLVKPYGEITLKGNFGEKATYDILPQNILSQSQRLLTATPSAEIECGDSKSKACQTPITLLLKGFYLGRYTLSTNINFGENSPNIFASTTFIAMPFKFLFGLILAIGIAIVVIRKIKEKDENAFQRLVT